MNTPKERGLTSPRCSALADAPHPGLTSFAFQGKGQFFQGVLVPFRRSLCWLTWQTVQEPEPLQVLLFYSRKVASFTTSFLGRAFKEAASFRGFFPIQKIPPFVARAVFSQNDERPPRGTRRRRSCVCGLAQRRNGVKGCEARWRFFEKIIPRDFFKKYNRSPLYSVHSLCHNESNDNRNSINAQSAPKSNEYFTQKEKTSAMARLITAEVLSKTALLRGRKPIPLRGK